MRELPVLAEGLLSLPVLVGRLRTGQTAGTAGTFETVSSPQVLGIELVGCEELGRPAQHTGQVAETGVPVGEVPQAGCGPQVLGAGQTAVPPDAAVTGEGLSLAAFVEGAMLLVSDI